MKTTVANLRDGIPPNSVYIGRGGRGFDGYFGNPFRLEDYGSREAVIAAFRDGFVTRIGNDDEYARRVAELEGKTLLCFCAPLPCHGDVIADYLNGGDVYAEVMRYMADRWGYEL